MRIAIGCDDIGFPMKSSLVSTLESEGHIVLDLGSFSTAPVDYPDYARAVGQAVLGGFADAGVLLCGSGVGACIAANKVRKVRAACCPDVQTARLSREQDNANVLCLAAGGVDPGTLADIARAWVAARFLGAEPHARRAAKITQIEELMVGGEKAGAASTPSALGATPEEIPPVPLACAAEPPVRASTPRRERRALDALYLPLVDETLGLLAAGDFPERLWTKDGSLWKGDPARIADGLGWLTAPTVMRAQVEDLRTFAIEIRRLQFTQVVVLGTGAASSCAEVFGRAFGSRMGFPDLLVLDTTDPAAVKHALDRVNVPRTLFVVSTKSGCAAETLALYHVCRERVEATRATKAGMQFVAITDPATPLAAMASETGFRRTFLNHPSTGERFGALSYFGLVPAALIGVDLKGLLDRARVMVEQSGSNGSARDSAALRLGAALAAFARRGRDKVTVVLSEPINAFGGWLEQLLAGSLGKDGTGLVPVVDEPLGNPAVYGPDRLFVALVLAGDGSRDTALEALAGAGHPVIRLDIEDLLDVGAEFFRWEVATAAAGALLGLNPFDEPDAAGATDHAERLLARWKKAHRFPDSPGDIEEDSIVLTAGANQKPASLAEGIMAHLAQAGPADHLAIQAYLEPTAETVRALQSLRTLLRDRLRIATTLGFGPGALHGAGATTGLFIQITGADREDLAIPGAGYDFSAFKTAQILGDLEALRESGRRVIRLHLLDKPPQALGRVLQLVRAATRAL